MSKWIRTMNNGETVEYTLTKKLSHSFKVDLEDLKNDDKLLDFLKEQQEKEFKNFIVTSLIGDYLKKEATRLHKKVKEKEWLHGTSMNWLLDGDYRELQGLLKLMYKLGVNISEYE